MGVVNLEIVVPDIAAALASFNVIRVQRSTTLDTGPYAELTKAPPTDSASLTGTLAGNFAAVGQTLSFLLDSQPQFDVTFTGTNPLTPAQVATQINTAVGATIATVNGSNRLVLTSTLTGTASKLQIVGGSAAATLGFTAGARVIGHEAYVPLISGQSTYTFADNDGQAGYFYEVAFYDTTSHLMSPWSAPFQGGPGTQLPSNDLSTGTINLVDAAGVAIPGQRISFFSVQKPLQVGGFQVALNRAPITIETDNAGHAEVSLVRGLSVRVVFHGTPVIRDIVIPDASTFDLLTLIEGTPDIFDVVTPNLPAAPRRTL